MKYTMKARNSHQHVRAHADLGKTIEVKWGGCSTKHTPIKEVSNKSQTRK